MKDACSSWRAEACLRIFSIITLKAEWGTVLQRRRKYPTKAALNRLWNPHEGCVLLMTGWSTSVNFLYITLKAEWGTVLQRRWKYPTKAALSGLWNPREGARSSWRVEAGLWIFSIHTYTIHYKDRSCEMNPIDGKSMYDKMSLTSIEYIQFKCMNIWRSQQSEVYRDNI